MCGIAGIVKLDPRERVDEARVKRMRDVLRHRGPDGEGCGSTGPVGLGHRRLAIVDVAGGASADGERGRERAGSSSTARSTTTPRCAPGLEARGHRYRTRSDTETILHLYEEEGERCVERLHGMFAFAIWDRDRRRLLLGARSPRHQAALLRRRPTTSCCSPPRSRRSSPPDACGPRFNRDVLPEFLATRFVVGRGDVLPRLASSCPGTDAHVVARTTGFASGATGSCRPRRPTARQRPRASARATSRDRLEAAVQSHLMSDVPLGLFLSGGIDSSGLAAPDGAAWSTSRSGPSRWASPSPRPTSSATRASRRGAVGAEHREVVVSPGGVLRGAAAARLARGRADRVPLERAALLRLAAGARPRQGRAHRRGRRRAVPRLQPLPRHGLERAARAAYWALVPAGVRARRARLSQRAAAARCAATRAQLPRARSRACAISSSRTSRSSRARSQRELLRATELLEAPRSRTPRGCAATTRRRATCSSG